MNGRTQIDATPSVQPGSPSSSPWRGDWVYQVSTLDQDLVFLDALRSLTEGFDTTTSGGKLVFHIFGSLSQFERDLISERTRAVLTAAARLKMGKTANRP